MISRLHGANSLAQRCRKRALIFNQVFTNVIIFFNTDHSRSSGGILSLLTRLSSIIICQFTLPYPMFVKHNINSLLVALDPLSWRQVSSAALQRSCPSSSSSWILAITHCLISNSLASFFHNGPVLNFSAITSSTPSVGGFWIKALAGKKNYKLVEFHNTIHLIPSKALQYFYDLPSLAGNCQSIVYSPPFYPVGDDCSPGKPYDPPQKNPPPPPPPSRRLIVSGTLCRTLTVSFCWPTRG